MTLVPPLRVVALAIALVAIGSAIGSTLGDSAGATGNALLVGQPDDERIHLGVLRADGLLLPFATFDGDEWKTPWPANLAGLDLPMNLEAIPQEWWRGDRPERWTLRQAPGGPPRTIAPTTPMVIQVGGSRRLALRTDQPPVPVPVRPFDIPFPKLGLAVAGKVDVAPLPSVERTDPGVPAFMQAIREPVMKAEEQTINGLGSNTGWRHPFDRKARSLVEPELEAWYTAPLNEPGARVSYVEIAKKYPPQPKDEGCGLETLITGWVHQTEKDRPDRPRTALRASVMYCDRDRASYMLPFGRITVRNRSYWVFQISGPQHEWYVVAEPQRTRVRMAAEYYAGGIAGPYGIR